MKTSPKLIDGVIDSFIQARHVWARNEEITIWGLHTPEGPEIPTYAEALGQYFATTNVTASTHFGTDNNSTVRYATDDQTCAAAKGANRNGLHVEIAGRAGQKEAGWLDDYSVNAIKRAAKLFVHVGHNVHGLPARLLTRDQIARKEKGIATHHDIQAVFGGDYRSDPGEHFPHDLHMQFIQQEINGMAPPISEWPKVWKAADNGDEDGIFEVIGLGLQRLGHWRHETAPSNVMTKPLRASWRRFEQAQGYSNPNDVPGKVSIQDFADLVFAPDAAHAEPIVSNTELAEIKQRISWLEGKLDTAAKRAQGAADDIKALAQ